MDALAGHRREILEHWYQLYLLHFGDERSLAQSEFFEICGLDLDATTETLGAGTFEQFVIRMRRIGVALAQRRVPFAEVVASMHLFEERAIANFPPGVDSSMYRMFDKVSHCRIIALSEAYFRSQETLAAARIQSLEKEAGPARGRAADQLSWSGRCYACDASIVRADRVGGGRAWHPTDRRRKRLRRYRLD